MLGCAQGGEGAEDMRFICLGVRRGGGAEDIASGAQVISFP